MSAAKPGRQFKGLTYCNNEIRKGNGDYVLEDIMTTIAL
jgi:hypothetical protein